MYLSSNRPIEDKIYYIVKGFRDRHGKATSKNMFRPGTLAEIREREGVSDPWQWAQEELAHRNEEERLGKQTLKIELSPTRRIKGGEQTRYSGGDLMLMPLYNALGLPQICRGLQKESTYFLVCFLAKVVLKMLQKRLDMPGLAIDRHISTLRSIEFDYFKSIGYRPLFERSDLTDRLQEILGISIDTEIVDTKRMNKPYRNLKED